jgi:hypothetical protein
MASFKQSRETPPGLLPILDEAFERILTDDSSKPWRTLELVSNADVRAELSLKV